MRTTGPGPDGPGSCSHQLGGEFGQGATDPAEESHIGRDGVALHALVSMDEPVGFTVEIGSVDLVEVTDEDDLGALRG